MDYGYANARIRGMKSRLLTHGALDDLIMKPDMDSLILELEKTPYKDEIQEAGTKYSGVYHVEYALRKNFTNTFKKILGFVEDTPAEQYIRIFLRRWDVQNIKTILRGKSIHTTADEIVDCLLPVGDLDDVTLGELIKQSDMKAVIDLMATLKIEYVKPLMRHFHEYSGENGFMIFESALDKYYYDNALAWSRGRSYDEQFIRKMLQAEIDVVNLKTILRMARDKAEPAEAKILLIEGGARLRMEDMVPLLEAKSVSSVLDRLKNTQYNVAEGIPEEHLRKEKISGIEKQLDRLIIMKGLNAFNGDPLSIAIAIGYFWAKYNEVTNIRVIARCKTADIPEERLREELFYV
ncbi:MAG TPA: V-type ATPase subunit [Methanocella sp.]|uniref:V-type ATPase subunit n=1 Tax=Methanocella sp. TaxID=2052833 RepID=UPI002CBC32E6|nr:V-type ATPase subunit [Methanocella sp.]HTY90092.1 V-type ATPase subunit [Methanocella sp.]